MEIFYSNVNIYRDNIEFLSFFIIEAILMSRPTNNIREIRVFIGSRQLSGVLQVRLSFRLTTLSTLSERNLLLIV